MTNVSVLQLDQMEAIEDLGADNILIAVPTDEFSGLRRCISKLNGLGKPIRIIVNSGNGMKVRDRVIELGRLQMLDLDPSPMPSDRVFSFQACFRHGVFQCGAAGFGHSDARDRWWRLY